MAEQMEFLCTFAFVAFTTTVIWMAVGLGGFACAVFGVQRLHAMLVRIPYNSRWDFVFNAVRLMICMLLGAALLGFVYLEPFDTTFATSRVEFLKRAICGAAIGAVVDFSLRRRK